MTAAGESKDEALRIPIALKSTRELEQKLQQMLRTLKPIEYLRAFSNFLPDANANKIKIPSTVNATKTEEL